MKTEEQFSAEESAALEEMKADTGEDIHEAPQEAPVEREEPAPQADPGDETHQEPEFKTAREKPEERPPEGFVPHQAMHAERMRRQALEKKVAELEALIPKPDAEKPPEWVDPLVDPEGYRRYDEWERKQTNEKLTQITRQMEERQAQETKARAAAELEAEFAAETPDYSEAVAFLHKARVSELVAEGLSPQEVKAQLQKDAISIFDNAQAIGMNPAEVLYIRAKRAGYTKAEPKPEVPNEADKVIALDKARTQTQGLGTASGPQSGKLTATDLANMTEAELAKVSPDIIREVMGG